MNLQENINRVKQLINFSPKNLFETKGEIKEKLLLKDWNEYTGLVAQAYLDAPVMETKAKKHWEALNESNYRLFRRLLSKVDIIFTTEFESEVGSVNIMGREFPIEYLPSSEHYQSQKEMKADYENTGKLKITIDYSDHPIFSVEDNIVFRTVHDFIVHILGDHEFGAKGEIASYNNHAKLAPPKALPALFTEIVGQAAVFVITGNFPVQKIAILKGFDYTQVGKVEDYEIENKTLVSKKKDRDNELY